MQEPSTYITKQNPRDKLWYVCGFIGYNNNKRLWMPVSEGHRNKSEADKTAAYQVVTDRAAKNLVSGV